MVRSKSSESISPAGGPRLNRGVNSPNFKRASRIVLAAFAVATALACVLAAVTGGTLKTMAGESVQYTVNTSSELTPVRLQGNSYAIQFNAMSDVAAVEFFVAKVSVSGRTAVTAEIYKWQGSYGDTVKKAAPAASQTFTGFGMNSWLRVESRLPAGEYLLVLKDSAGNVQLAVEADSHPFARTYLNTAERNGNIEVKVVFADEAGTLGAVSGNNVRLVRSQGTWVATDGLGRDVGVSYKSTERANKTVGVFFHTWHTSLASTGTRNVTTILAAHPEIQNDFESPLWGGNGSYHWNEPVWGYYVTTDEWVLRRQAEMLADAGVDAVFFDNSNGVVTFAEETLTLLKVWAQARADGVNTPKISFMLPMFDYDSAAVQIRELYDKIYKDGLYKDLWFYWDGKPLMISWPGKLNQSDPTDAKITEFFTWRVINHCQSEDGILVQDEDGKPVVEAGTPQEIIDNYTLWNWIAVTPQIVNRDAEGNAEEVAVAIAQNWCAETHCTAMNNPLYKVFGRHYMPSTGDFDPRPNAKLYGAYFSEQWEYALSVDPEIVWVTGWNEGRAGRYEDFWGVSNAFIDNFNDEFSRDIEPSKGDLQDHYYYLLCKYVREYKGVPAAPVQKKPVTIDVSTGNGWQDVSTVYESYAGDTFDRNSKGYKNAETGEYFVYTDTSGRNDIVSAKASYDKDYVYFMAETAEDLTPCTDPQWMRLFIRVAAVGNDLVERDSWESFQYVVNRESPSSGGKTVIERSKGGWNWEKCGDCDFGVNGNVLTVRVPREALELGSGSFVLDFKWADNNLADGSDVLELYTKGDTAPGGRFMYRFVAGKLPKAFKKGCGSALAGTGAGALLLGVAAGAAISGKISGKTSRARKRKDN